jgi:predicted ribosome quality control (RQC) complex YloA/Tae2 family protein
MCVPFDALTMAAAADDLHAVICGGRVQKVIQPSQWSIGLSIYAGGESHWMLLSADPAMARVHLSSQRLAKAYAEPTPFVMLLRKYLDGGRVVAVKHLPYERILELEVQARGDEVRLIGEVMGRHSNVMLVEGSRVLGALKIVSPAKSRVRPILPGHEYSPPPAQPPPAVLNLPTRVDPARNAGEFVAALSRIPSQITLQSALSGVLPGAGPFLVTEIIARCGLPMESVLGSADPKLVTDAAASLYELYQTRQWHPCTFDGSRGRRDFAPFLPTGMERVQKVDSISEAIDAATAGLESRDALQSTRAVLLKDIERAEGLLARRVSSMRTGLEAAESAEELMQQGQLILAFLHLVSPRAPSLDLPDLGVSIPLDPRLTPQQNAERLFKRYRKHRDATKRLPDLIARAEADLARLTDLKAFAGIATTETELRALRRDLEGDKQEVKRKGKASQPVGPAGFALGNHHALVGRNAKENETATFKLAKRDDLWLHARERTGAHVILAGGASANEEIIQQAAQLAAYFSEGRSDTRVDVDVTSPRNVRKIPGGPPGRVTYRDFRTLRVTPTRDGWEPGPTRAG